MRHILHIASISALCCALNGWHENVWEILYFYIVKIAILTPSPSIIMSAFSILPFAYSLSFPLSLMYIDRDLPWNLYVTRNTITHEDKN